MIEIRNLRGDLADLAPNTSITFEKNNPLFNDEDKLFEDITYGFKMPATPGNKIFFDGGHLIETPNKFYEMPCQTIVDGSPFFAGTIRVSFKDGQFDALLKVNFGTIAEKVRTVKISEIFYNDAYEDPISAALMKSTVENPKNYNFSFFPVYNEKWNGSSPLGYSIINEWNHATQSFRFEANNPKTPYFKLKYVLTQVLGYLGFKCEGSYIDDPESEKDYVYSPVLRTPLIINSNYYLPNDLLITDFLKEIKERFKISCSFDVFRGVVKIESGNALIKSPDLFDIRRYITAISEINTPAVNGYTITLKPNTKDPLFKDPGDASKFLPTNKLVIGSGEKNVELATSTLKSKEVADYAMPSTEEQLILFGAFQMRFLRFNGMKSVAGGKVFPQADPLELSDSDALWHRFMNDGKPVRLTAKLPVYLVSDFTCSRKIGITSEQGFYTAAIAEKISGNLTNEKAEFVEVTIDCRTVIIDYSTPIKIIPFPKTEAESAVYNNNLYKAYFAETGFSEVEIKAFYPAGTNGFEPGMPLATSRTDSIIISESTDKMRGGGQSVYMPFINIDTVSRKNQEIRVYKGIPKYVIALGLRFDFTLHASGYYFCKPFAANGFAGTSIDYQPIWVVF